MDTGATYVYRTNLAQSIHKGLESYVELNITRWLRARGNVGR
jgi:Fe(3+) dicitrate transport protein